MSSVYAKCRSPRAEVVKVDGGFRSRVKVTRSGWMESPVYRSPEDALAVCRRYIREVSQGRIDPMRALKIGE